MNHALPLALVAALALPSAAAAAFSRGELLSLHETVVVQADSARRDFLRVRDEVCRGQTEECIAALAPLGDRFEELSETVVRIDDLTRRLEDPAVLAGLSAAEKREIRRDYAKLLSASVIWVHGLDAMLEMSWGDQDTRTRLDAAQRRLEAGVDRFADRQFALARRVQDLFKSLPL